MKPESEAGDFCSAALLTLEGLVKTLEICSFTIAFKACSAHGPRTCDRKTAHVQRSAKGAKRLEQKPSAAHSMEIDEDLLTCPCPGSARSRPGDSRGEDPSPGGVLCCAVHLLFKVSRRLSIRRGGVEVSASST